MRCAPDRSSRWWLFVLFCLVLLFCARTAWGQETQPPSLPMPGLSTPNTSQSPTSDWQTFTDAWAMLKAELIASAEDSEKLLTQLERLQTEAAELRSLLQLSTEQYKALEAAMAIERARAEAMITDRILRGVKAEKERDAWRTGAVIAGGIGLAGWLAFALSHLL